MKFGKIKIAMILSLGFAVCPSAYATQAGELVYRGMENEADRTIHYDPNFLRTQNLYDIRQQYGVATMNEEKEFYVQRSAAAVSATRQILLERARKIGEKVLAEINFKPSDFIKGVASVVGGGVAIYNGQAMKLNLGKGYTLTARTAFSSHEGYFSSISKGRFGVLWSRAMVSSDQSVGTYFTIPALEVQSTFTFSDAAGCECSLSKNLSKGLDVTVAQGTGGRSPASAQVRFGYGVSF